MNHPPSTQHLLKLTADSTRDKELGVSVSEEVGRVSNNLADVKVCTSVDAIVKNTGPEWTSQAAGRDATLIGSSRIGERNARRSRAALGSLVDVC